MLLLLAATAHAGTSTLGPWTVTWSDSTVSVSGGGAPVLEKVDAPGETSSTTWQMIALVGPWMTLEHDWYHEGGAHPSYGTRWETVDITRGGAPVSLADLWPEDVLIDTLLADTVVKDARRGEGRPSSLAALLDSLDGGCEMSMGGDMLTRWAIHSVQGDEVAVRVGMSHGCEVQRGTFTQLGLLLPIPDSMVGAVKAADQAGTLYEDLAPKKK